MRALLAGVFLLAGCNSLFGIPGSGELIGDGGGDDDGPPPDVNCEAAPQNCALLAVDRSIAKDGETITLEGTFGNTVSVTFPEGVTSEANMVGSHRARVTVPTGVTTGAIEISTAGTMVGKVAFHGTSYRVGPTHFQVEYAQTNGARQSTPLQTARGGAAALTIRDHVFVIGGQNATDALRTIEVATINADGTLSPFKMHSNLLGNRTGATAHVLGNHIYVIGGRPALTGALVTTEVASIDLNGDFGPFTGGPPLATARAGHRSVVIGNNLYVIGGIGADGNALTSVERATIAPDGTLGNFSIVGGISLVEARGTPAVVVIRDRLYVLGGTAADGGGGLTTVERSVIKDDGTLETFEVVGSMSTARAAHGAFAFGDKLVVIGGLGVFPVIERSIEQAQILANGDLGAFGVAPARTEAARAGAAFALAGNELYVIGGLTNNGAAVAALETVEHTSLISSVDLGPYMATGVSVFSPARIGFSVATLGNNLYVIGGAPNGVPTRLVERSPVNAAGTPGAFASDATALFSGRSRHVTAIAGSHVTVVGGTVNSGGNTTNSSEQASINPDGTLTAFNGQAAVGVTGRADATSAIVQKTLFVFGGGNSTGTPLASVEAAQVNMDGTITNFSNNGSMSSTRKGHCTAVIGPFVYHVSGDIGGLASTTIERQTISGGVVSAGTQITSTLTSVRGTVTCAVIGRFLYVFGSDNNDGRRVERASIDPATFDLGQFTIVMPLLGPRFEPRVVQLGNGLFVVGGNDGGGNLQNALDRAALQ